MKYIQQTDCEKWQFENIPPFTGGKMNPLFADCGTGLCRGLDKYAEDCSFMHIFNGVSADEITAYAELLEADFAKIFQNEIGGNLFYQFRVPEGFLYISFMKNSGIARFILDRCTCVGADSFGYGEFTEIHPDTVLVQYSLFYDKMIKGVSCDCGMNYVFRLRDNSLVIIDGGEMEQATDIAVSDYMSFLHGLTGTSSDEKMKVALWLCTHAHNDHCDFMSKLVRFHHSELDVERIAFNFPNPQNTRHSPSINALRQRLLERYPGAKYIKLHAGTQFSIADAQFRILVSNEDAMGIDGEDPFPGTNSTSVVFSVEAEGIKTLFLADCGEDNGSVLIDNYGADVTDCVFLQAAHHGINRIYSVYDRLNAEKILLPQCRMNAYTRFAEVYNYLRERYGEESILFANDATDIFTMRDGEYKHEKRAQVGSAYDKSQW